MPYFYGVFTLPLISLFTCGCTLYICRDDFFEDMLYKIVLIVHHGLIRPNDGARLLQGCASVLGLHLLKEPPKTTLIIRGLRKTNDLAQGHHFLLKEFAPYGDVVDASICPKNKGFGTMIVSYKFVN